MFDLEARKMHGARRVFVFCTLTTLFPTILLVIPLYLRHSFYANVVYPVTESDILEINDGISTVFCSAHTLQMNESFNAFQMSNRPELTSSRKKHIRLKKSMNLPDDTLEYWGFYLLKGATVALSVCSRYQGASILVVKGERDLRTCGILEHNEKKGLVPSSPRQQVKITFETNAQEVHSKENLDPNKIKELRRTAESYAQKHMELNSTRKLRHAKRRLRKVEIEEERTKKKEQRIQELLLSDVEEEKNNVAMESTSEEILKRRKRNQEPSILDQGIRHGGNVDKNTTDPDARSSVSSFENGLLNCYGDSILLSREFVPSEECVDVNYMLNTTARHIKLFHNVTEDGYYYYMFYSDNDFVSNDIHALFDIYKPTFQYQEVSKRCLNSTQCSFSLTMLSPDRVIVEIPTRDGIEHENDDISLLTSTCHPRTGLYMVFPIAVLLLVLSFAFM